MKLGPAVLLVGHGGVPSDLPRTWLSELKSLEGRRRAAGTAPCPRELELDRQVRGFPRTPLTDPYGEGVERLATALAGKLGQRRLLVAYNEFAEPSVESGLNALIAEGYRHIIVVPTMLTPGGSHSELEIPECIDQVRRTSPETRIEYAWPFDMERVAGLLAERIEETLSQSS